jgi:hypothetical protein
MSSVSPLELLRRGVGSYAPYLHPSGELYDPVFDQPTQYGTPYYAYCNAVLASRAAGEERTLYLTRAASGLDAALRHVEDTAAPPHASSFRREEGTTARRSHREFFWPPSLKTYAVLERLEWPETAAFAERIAAVDLSRAFRAEPPSNWAAVWLSGEWLRLRQGLSPYDGRTFDGWLRPFFEGSILLERGFYQEPGHSNSYDLFTRYHLLELLQEGYDGRWLEALERLMVTGFRRSLAVQLSDGSLASAHRSTGQTWTLGAQCAYFACAARYFEARDAEAGKAAWGAARRAFASLRRWERRGAPFSPVENCLPPAYRVGYESYTADGHYAPLALSFLATALEHGLHEAGAASPEPRLGLRHLEGDPLYRAVLHRGSYSVHVNAYPAPAYDAFGIVDLTTGPGRYLHFASSVRHVGSGLLYNLGLASRDAPGRAPLTVMAHQDFSLLLGIEAAEDPFGLRLEGRAKGQRYTYALEVRLAEDGVHVSEATAGYSSYKTLLIPYLRDPGTGVLTEPRRLPSALLLEHGSEQLEVAFTAPVASVLVLPYGYENRRGLCGLVRVDFADLLEGLSYRVSVVR